MIISSGMAPILSLGLVGALIPLACSRARRAGFVDTPDARKVHEESVPPIGGLVIFPVFILVHVLSGDVAEQTYWFYAALILLLVVGGLDDLKSVPAWTKFTVQCLASVLIVVPGQAVVHSMGDLFGFGRFGLEFMAVPFSVIAAVLLINAVNLLDGLDGLAGGLGVIVLGWFVIASGGAAPPEMIILIAALAGFLFHNMRRPGLTQARVFLGDAGSLALGLTLAWYSIHLAGTESDPLQPISIAWLLALPIYDTCGQFARRMREGRHPFDADRHHFHHHFLASGVPVGRATSLILLIVFLTGLIGIGGIAAGLPPAVLTYPWIAGLFVHIYLAMHPAKFQKLVHTIFGKDHAS